MDSSPHCQATKFHCADGVVLGGHVWSNGQGRAVVIVNAATAVLARYYHRYASYLVEHGFDVLTYDYRGIGQSRPANLRRVGYRWSDWGTQDFASVLDVAVAMARGRPVMVVGHSIGGFLPGMAAGFERASALLTVGAQYAYWPDYAASKRLQFVLRWHVAMPILTALLGYFPGRKLGWLEDLPAGVAYEWAFRGAKIETSLPAQQRATIVERLAAFRGPLLATAMSDDPYATPAAIQRALAYYSGARSSISIIRPAELGLASVGHFDLFHARHRDGFWRATVAWLVSDGRQWSLGAPPHRS